MKKILVVALIGLLTACAGNNFNWDSARQIKEGMSEAEMLTLMGNPNAVKSDANGLIYVWTHVNGLTGSVKTVSAVVKDGKVTSAPVVPAGY